MLEGYPVVIEVPVRWGDMDLLGHVNNIMYLRYFEAARIEYMARAGLGPPGPAWRDHGFIVASLDCHYRAPVTFPDTVSAGARVSALGNDRMVMEHAIFSPKLGRVAAEGEALLISFEYASGRRIPIPRPFRDAILALESRDLPAPPPYRRARTTR